MIFGYLLGVHGEVRFSAIGVVFGVLSSLFVALYSIWIKYILKNPQSSIVWPPRDHPDRYSSADDNKDDWLLMLFNNQASFLLLIPLIFLTGESAEVLASPMIRDPTFLLVNVGAGAMGFLINIATFLQVKATSPVTHNVVATAKSAIQTVLSLFIWQNPISFMNGLGIALTLVGFMYYSFVKDREMRAAAMAKNSARDAARK